LKVLAPDVLILGLGLRRVLGERAVDDAMR
jgi:hypothetical protein